MKDMMIFTNNNLGEIRVAKVNGETYFCAINITNALGYSNGKEAVARIRPWGRT